MYYPKYTWYFKWTYNTPKDALYTRLGYCYRTINLDKQAKRGYMIACTKAEILKYFDSQKRFKVDEKSIKRIAQDHKKLYHY